MTLKDKKKENASIICTQMNFLEAKQDQTFTDLHFCSYVINKSGIQTLSSAIQDGVVVYM